MSHHDSPGHIDCHIERVREVGAALYVVIGDEAEDATLCIHGGFFVEGPVFEVEGQMSCHAVAVHHLDQIAIGKYLALLRGQREKAMKCPLEMTGWNRFRASDQLASANQRDGGSKGKPGGECTLQLHLVGRWPGGSNRCLGEGTTE